MLVAAALQYLQQPCSILRPVQPCASLEVGLSLCPCCWSHVQTPETLPEPQETLEKWDCAAQCAQQDGDPSLLYLLSTTFGSGITQYTPPTKPGTAQSGQVINEHSEVPSSSASLTRCPRGPSCTTPPRCSPTAPLVSPVQPIHPSVRPSVPPHPHGQHCTRQHPSLRGSPSTGGAVPGAGGTPGAGPSRPKKQSQRHGEGELEGVGWDGLGRDGMGKLGQKGWEGKIGMERMGQKGWDGNVREGTGWKGWEDWDARDGLGQKGGGR